MQVEQIISLTPRVEITLVFRLLEKVQCFQAAVGFQSRRWFVKWFVKHATATCARPYVAALLATASVAPAANASEIGEDLFSLLDTVDKAADKVEAVSILQHIRRSAPLRPM